MKKYLSPSHIVRSLLIVVTLLTLFNCEALFLDCDTYDFSDCPLDEPLDAEMFINLSDPSDFDSVLVTIYNGIIENEDTIDFFFAESDQYSIWLMIDKRYSATAEYFTGSYKTTVVDGSKLRTNTTTRCEETCYLIKGDELKLQLKNI